MAFTPTNDPVNVERITMEMLHVAFHCMLPDYPLLDQTAKLRVWEHAAGGIVMQLQAWLLDGHKQDKRVEYDEFEIPASPWEFLKQRYAPKWFLAKWPVKMETKRFKVAIHHHYVCPHVNKPVDDRNGPYVHYAWMGKMSGQLRSDEGR